MKIIRIFVDSELNGLHSIRYDDEEWSEFRRLLELWTDTEYVTNYCADNEAYLKSEYFSNLSIDDIISKILREAMNTYGILKRFSEESFLDNSESLQTRFKPLDNNEISIPSLQKTKYRHENKKTFPDSILRIYALRISENMFIVTGGAIKMVKQMDDHPHTQLELEKLKVVAGFLRDQEILNEEGLIYYYESN